jgi:hypothetical protein
VTAFRLKPMRPRGWCGRFSIRVAGYGYERVQPPLAEFEASLAGGKANLAAVRRSRFGRDDGRAVRHYRAGRAHRHERGWATILARCGCPMEGRW